MQSGQATAATDAAQGYRLAGTVAVGSDFLAFLEVPGGGQVLVRNGDTVGKARVAAIRDRAIDLVVPGGRIELALEGTGKPAAAVPGHDVVTRQSSVDHVLQREVDVDALGQSMRGATPARGDPGTALAGRFTPILNLPAQARVVSVNGRDVASADAAVREVERTLEGGGIIYMNLDTPNGFQRVYLTPRRPEPDSAAP
ncbi:MAG: hypothetical protein NDI84_12815 [Steroidobacteraceae bacterium]|nr:hypothetical protein [Steroidobacteraceae bacterium]